MEKETAINMAVTSVISSFLDNQTKEEVIEVLRKLGEGDRNGKSN